MGSLELAPDDYVLAKNATVRLAGVPVFYFPRYKYDLDAEFQRFEIEPGFRNKLGAYLLTTYNWYGGERGSAGLKLDYLTERGARRRTGGPL